MADPGSTTKKWYRCPYCWNYSVRPMKCCGENMVEVVEEDDDEKEFLEGKFVTIKKNN